MFPLRQRKLIRGAAAHVAAGLGVGADYVAKTGTVLYAPFDGKVETYWGRQGGNWLRLVRDNGDAIECAHLDDYIVSGGRVREGDKIAHTGNTGAVTTGPHLHIQIKRKGRRLDPQKYTWDNSTMEDELKKQVRRLHKQIRSLTDDVVSLQRELTEERRAHKETLDKANVNYSNWQREIEEKNKCRQALKTCKNNKFSGMSTWERILWAFRH